MGFCGFVQLLCNKIGATRGRSGAVHTRGKGKTRLRRRSFVRVLACFGKCRGEKHLPYQLPGTGRLMSANTIIMTETAAAVWSRIFTLS